MEADLQDAGLDLGDADLIARRTWPWLRTRILGLLTADTRLARTLALPAVPDEIEMRRNRGARSR